MRSLTLILLFTTVTIAVCAQATKKVTVNSGTKYTPLVETYYVLKSDESIRQGPYEFKRKGGNTYVQGFYKNGKKDSLWESFYGAQHVVVARRWYDNGVRKGVWEFYDSKGEMESSFDCASGKMNWMHSKFKPSDTATFFYAAPDGQWVRGALDVAPARLCGSIEWLGFLNRTLRYPDEAVNKEQMGNVIVAVTIGEDGIVSDCSVFQSSSFPSLDREALRVVKLFDGEYVAAERQGKKVRSLYLETIHFKLETN